MVEDQSAMRPMENSKIGEALEAANLLMNEQRNEQLEFKIMQEKEMGGGILSKQERQFEALAIAIKMNRKLDVLNMLLKAPDLALA